ncbi:ABC transporter substrate-binding protein [Bacillus badius]|uniref:ABC transporter substrate-binding protein n=1 Tax=Bacillus badius TaxID=1455 RepID=A0ABR5ATS3_BACBA|nr:ABC transporter substrate-binding protein [Bacillus badius]KIL72828.1 ABC transporter substrate-binding protein [Bacillus badius]KIL78154.1 ABC transporter substrate-binding protein [Bacillus badius]KZN98499.1 sugar ABC transporter substrate-binding protein [Bacillus badius]MED0666155.1 ABC transporter substrate-binding protein [Bacillus badius]MED4718350.1 ABC transporter substrate-binding protein [Bacillus badius]
MKKWLLGVMLGLLLVLAACSSDGNESGGGAEGEGTSKKKDVKVGITQLVEHPSLDGAREGFIEALKDAGYEEGKNLTLDYQNAQADVNNNMTIAQKLVNDGNDLILAISTPSAQAALQATKDIPVLFTAITDPVSAKLVKSMEEPGGNVTGTSDTHPEAIKNTIASIKEFFPDAKKVGIIYNSGEPNSVVNVDKAKKALKENGMEAVEVTVSASSEVKQAAETLVGRADVLYIPKDNTVVSALESVLTVANAKKIPAFVGESDSVKRGGFASYGFEYHDLGYSTGKMAVDILEGKKPSDIPVGVPENLELVVNKKTADLLGVKLTEEQQKKAKIVE